MRTRALVHLNAPRDRVWAEVSRRNGPFAHWLELEHPRMVRPRWLHCTDPHRVGLGSVRVELAPEPGGGCLLQIDHVAGQLSRRQRLGWRVWWGYTTRWRIPSSVGTAPDVALWGKVGVLLCVVAMSWMGT